MLSRCRHRGLFARSGGALVTDPAYRLIERGAVGAKAVGLVRAILIAEGDAADDETILAHGKIVAHELRMRSQRRLRNRRDTEALGGEEKGADVSAAIDGAIGSKRLVRGDDRDVRRTEKSVVLKHLYRRGSAVAALDADCVVERETAGAPARELGAAVFARKSHIGRGRRAGR